MKNLVLGALTGVTLICAGGAQAADMSVRQPPMMPVAPAGIWTGFYIGANGGWGWSKVDTSVAPFGATALADFAPFALSSHGNAAAFGGQAGYNWQLGDWVFGLEGDFDGASIGGTQQSVFTSILAPGNTNGFMATDKINWLASIRGRVGYVWGPGLLYFTGGGAWENVTTTAMISANTGLNTFGDSASGSFSNTFSGFVIGGGYEWMIAPSWTVRGEYLFYDFSNNVMSALALPNCAVAGCGANVSKNNNELSVFRLGANYKF